MWWRQAGGIPVENHTRLERAIVPWRYGNGCCGQTWQGEEICPVIGLVVAENTEELFDFLVDALCFSVGLGVKGSGQGLVNIEFVPSFSHEFGGKLRTSV